MDLGANQKTSPGPRRDSISSSTLTGLSLVFSCFLMVVCAGGRQPNPSKVREEIQQLGFAHFSNKQIEVQNVSLMNENQAVAEVQIQSAFQLIRDKNKDWQVQSIRVGDRNWIDLKEFQEALNLVLAKQTRESLQKLLEGLNRYKQANGAYPDVPDIVKLTDILVPVYLSQVIRYDAWNRQLVYKASGANSFQLSSLGADGAPGTMDDVILVP